MDDAGQVRLVLGAHREDVAVAADRVVRVAQHADDLAVLQHLLEPLLDAAVQPAGALAKLREESAGTVEQLARRIESALELGSERIELAERLADLRVQRSFVLSRQAEAPRGCGGAHQPRHREKLLGLQRPFASGPAQGRAQIERIGQRHLALQPPERSRFFDQREPRARLFRRVARHEGRASIASHRSPGSPCQLRPQSRPAQFRQRLLVHHPEHHGRGRLTRWSPPGSERLAASPSRWAGTPDLTRMSRSVRV